VNFNSIFKKRYKYYILHNIIWREIEMRETGSVNMVSFVRGTVGELGKNEKGFEEEKVEEPVNLEILSVGPLFQEVDHKRLYWQTKKAPFFKHVPM
jgi:hypothetical protein